MTAEMVLVDAAELADLRAMAGRVEQAENEPMPVAAAPGMAAALAGERYATAQWIRTGQRRWSTREAAT